MKKFQWLTFATVFFLTSLYFLFWDLSLGTFSSSWSDAIILVSRASAFLFVIFIGLAITFFICSRLEKKKK